MEDKELLDEMSAINQKIVVQDVARLASLIRVNPETRQLADALLLVIKHWTFGKGTVTLEVLEKLSADLRSEMKDELDKDPKYDPRTPLEKELGNDLLMAITDVNLELQERILEIDKALKGEMLPEPELKQ